MKKWLEIALHLFYWFFVIWVISVMDFRWAGFSNEDGTLTIPLFYGMATNALIFYGNAFFLYPYLINRKKNKPLYWVLTIGLLFLINYLEAITDTRLNAYYHTDLHQALLEQIQDQWASMWIIPFVSSFTSTLPFNLIHLVFSFAYRWGKDSLENERQKRILIEEKLSAELLALRSQINPHFLFNSLNNIYFQILQEKPDHAVKTLLMLSDILRYQLYECNDGPVLLEKEVAYIQNYIALEKVRQGEKLKTEFEIDGDISGIKVEPFIFINFIENGFKHSQGAEEVWVKLKLVVKEKQLFFDIKNAIPLKAAENDDAQGIGLPNIQRRLELLYPQRHKLEIKELPESFSVSLILDI